MNHIESGPAVTPADPDAAAKIAAAPLPTARTLARRRNIPYQLVRFAVQNGNIVMMVIQGHRRSAKAHSA